AHNGLWAYGKRTGEFDLPRMYQTKDYATIKTIYKDLKLPNIKIVLTGTGRVANGAALVLEDMGIKKVNALDFVTNDYDQAVFTQLNSFYYTARKDGKVFDSAMDFYQNPTEYKSDFHHFVKHADIFINGIYWDNDAPAFFTKEDMKSDAFNIKVIADVTCDIAPVSSIPSTLKATTIPDPVFGYNPEKEKEDAPFLDSGIDMMTIDNLPNELPRDASESFGEMFIEHVLPELENENSSIIEHATLCKNGRLGSYFQYLSDYVNTVS
ncbi:MAG: alanine dehydrogenase, partial [Saprospiraceae bacterium]|nr:alanine dehydrogenase [Saprospiraceae bacterium]